MSSGRSNHLGLSKLQRMLPLQQLMCKQEDERVGSCELGRSSGPLELACCSVIADEFGAVTD